MQLTDELLSGFLDASLSEAEMAFVREHLLDDEHLADRLASLAIVDTLVQQHAMQIDSVPLPEAITLLLEQAEPVLTQNDNVVSFPWWRRVSQQLQQHAAAVACVALVAGYGVAQFAPDGSGGNGLALHITTALDSVPSGREVQMQGQVLTPQLSFISNKGGFCRYYIVKTGTQQTENIACRTNEGWQQHASLAVAQQTTAGYQTASAAGLLEPVLDELMTGTALDLATEAQHLRINP